MQRILITGWRVGLKKVSLTRFFKDRTTSGLNYAVSLTKKVLDKETFEFYTKESDLPILDDLGVEYIVNSS